MVQVPRPIRRRRGGRVKFALDDTPDYVPTKLESTMNIISVTFASLLGVVLVTTATALVLSFAEVQSFPPKPTLPTLLILVCISLTISLASIWYLASAEHIYLDSSARTLMGRVLIAALLGAVAMGATITFKNYSGLNNPEAPVKLTPRPSP